MSNIFEIDFTEEDLEWLRKSEWLREVTARRQKAESDPSAMAEITRGGRGREEILACFDSGQWTHEHILDGRQPHETHRARGGLSQKIEDIESGTEGSHLISVNARDERRSICRAVRLLIVATIEQKIGKMAIQDGLTEADQMNEEALRARTQFSDGGQSALARMDELSDLEDRLFGAYLDLEITNGRTQMDTPLVKVALKYEILILETLLDVYENNIDDPNDNTSEMLGKAGGTITKLKDLKQKLGTPTKQSLAKDKTSGGVGKLLVKLVARAVDRIFKILKLK